MRRNHLPNNASFHGAGYAYADGDLSFDPVLQIDDATVELHTVGLKYIRTFEVLGRSARIDLAGAYQEGTWKGTLAGAPARVERHGWADPIARVAVNLDGAPPLEGKEYASYRAGIETETIVGAAVAVHFPLGEYKDEKLINLGTNRFTIRPQLGVVYDRGPWGFELTGSTWIFPTTRTSSAAANSNRIRSTRSRGTSSTTSCARSGSAVVSPMASARSQPWTAAERTTWVETP